MKNVTKNKGAVSGELTSDHVRKHKIQTLSLKEYITQYHPGLTNQALDYAMRKGYINYVKKGRFRYICLTAKTADYVPRQDKTRTGRGTAPVK